jgi:hypothetical protein
VTESSAAGGATARRDPGESRFPAAAAIVAAIALYLLLPNPLILGPRLAVSLLELALFFPLVLANPRRMTKETTLLLWLSIGLVLLIALANAVALVLLVDPLVHSHTRQGGQLLLGAGQVWVTNMIVFALAFWEKRGSRRAELAPRMDGLRRTRSTASSARSAFGLPLGSSRDARPRAAVDRFLHRCRLLELPGHRELAS